MNLLKIIIPIICLHLLSSCKTDNPNVIPEAPDNSATPYFHNLFLTTDKCAYMPGEEIIFEFNSASLPMNAKVRYKYMNITIFETNITSATWKWTAPASDFRGYLAEVYNVIDGVEIIYATVGIDVSSDWKKFPRYGFLSSFGELSDTKIHDIISNLNKYHINGLQFYDWLGKHHQPLTMNGLVPATIWKDIINRDIYFSTVEKYINSAHNHNMKAMFYNLIYGAWDNAETDGVKKEWYVYNDNTHTNLDFHPLGSPFLSNIYLLDPSNAEWQQYAINETKKVYQFLDFDGFHMDQLGNRGTKYKYEGTYLNLAYTYQPFIDAVNTSIADKYNVMNAVSQYGQQGIATAGTDFLYTEVWSPYDRFSDLANIIKQNNSYSNNSKNTVLAAYMNYNLANNTGFFNTASVLMCNSVIFAFGGSHIELGEHMLGKEYFPNSNLSMREDLKTALLKYYDFLVAYQNLLRDGGTFNNIALTSIDNKISIENWPASQGKVAVFGRKFDTKQVIHLINMTNSTTLNWRDNSGTQVAPVVVKNAKLVLTSDVEVKKIWLATPDFLGGMSRTLNFNQLDNNVSFILPELQYWDMLIIEY